MENVTTTFLIPNELCRRAGIAASWRPLNEISVFPFEKRTHKQKDAPSAFASDTPTSIFHVRHDVILFHPILRKLVNESNGTFLNLQELIKEKPINLRSHLVNFSRQYRSIIRACLENLQDDVNKENNSDELENYITIFYSVECIWHLIEILFIDNVQIVVSSLLEWVRFHFPKHERNAAILLSQGTQGGLESQDTYWPTVFGNLMQGRIKVVRALLRQHGASDSPVFLLVHHLLQSMPTYTGPMSTSVSEFSTRWRQWVIDIQCKLDAKQFISNSNLNKLMRLVVGEELAWAEVAPHCESWYEFMAGWLFFNEPTAKTYELSDAAKLAINRMSVGRQMKHLDRVLLAAMDNDVFEVIREIQQMTENGWFVSHLTDILYHCGKLSALESEVEGFSAKNLRESFILDYGTTMMGHKSLWSVGLTYLDHCSKDGRRAIELILPRIPFDSEAKVHKLVREAKRRKLVNVANGICKVQGMRSLSRGRLGNALTWALKSQDGQFTSFLADKFLREYIEKGELHNTDLLDNLGSCMLASDRLIFLGKYNEFHRLYQAGEYKICGQLLVALLASKIVPKYFWSVLLSESIPLLESEELVFSSNDTYTILHCLEEHEKCPELVDKVKILRLAAGRNLSRSLMYEAQILA